MLTFHPGSKGKRLTREDSFERSIETIAGVLENFRNRINAGKTVLCYENMDNSPDKLCRSPEENEEYLRRLPDLWMTFDIAHAGLNSLDIGAFLERLGKRVRHIHASGVVPEKSHGDVSVEESLVDLVTPLGEFLSASDHRDIVVCLENRTMDLAMASQRFLERNLRGGL